MEKIGSIKYNKEYQVFIKKITDQYIKILEGDYPYNPDPNWERCSDYCPPPTKKQREKFHRERNVFALKWLKSNMITYEQWLKKF